MVYDLDN